MVIDSSEWTDCGECPDLSIRDHYELWEMASTVTKFIVIRLKVFRDLYTEKGTPSSLKGADQSSPEAHAEWLADIDKIITAFEFASDENLNVCAHSSSQWPDHVTEGWELFWKHRYFDFWD